MSFAYYYYKKKYIDIYNMYERFGKCSIFPKNQSSGNSFEELY